ncbi:uncharacterized protein KD926_008418 [Aspergillus affinis]|uniref:uncharacterized protein n=1 Tax=Aspergillus affinis TaxID=1070780 RepID=UPI0022FE364E|nr:uncharacterized protein KD926_008418 [Aspergillus affinis]KAI9040328.1 hypothetical protein KD926_008418 [Aspergillus affinis]
MRAGLLRQLREEIAQQLREEIRREMHAEQNQPSTQQQHQETNRDTYERNAEIRKPTTLNGRDNYTTWRDSIQMDAHMIEAKEILDQIKPPDGNEIDIARWQTKNEILHTRILQTIASHVRETIS